MKKIFAMISARNKEFYRDRAALIWTLVFPLVVLLGFTYGYSGKQEPLMRVAVLPQSLMQDASIQSLAQMPGVKIHEATEISREVIKVQRYESDLLISIENGKLGYYLNADSEKGRLAEKLFLAETLRASPDLKPEVRKVEGRRIRYSDWVLPGLLAMNIMFGSMFGVGYVIVRYRKNGVLKRLRATPLSALQFLVAQIVSRVLLMLCTSFLVLFCARLAIGFEFQGSYLDLALFLMVSSASMISVGLLVAARLANEEVAEGVLNLMTWPMIFLSGIWFSLDGASSWVVLASKALPLSHVVIGLRAIMIDGTSLSQLTPEIGLLCAISTVFVTIGSAIFRWR